MANPEPRPTAKGPTFCARLALRILRHLLRRGQASARPRDSSVPSGWSRADRIGFSATVLTALAVVISSLIIGFQQHNVASEANRLATWSEKVKELRLLYPRFLEAGGGTRPLRDPGYFHLFDSLRLLCEPFTHEPTQRVNFDLVQMAQHARFMVNVGYWSTELEREYGTCFPLAERLAKLELGYPPVSEESLACMVRRFREHLAPNESVGKLIGLTRTNDSALILYVSSDSQGLDVVRATGHNVRVDFTTSMDSVRLREYDAVVVDGAVDTGNTGQLGAYVSQGGGLVMSGQAPFLLAGESQFLGPISDWFGANFLLWTKGSTVTPAARHILDFRSDKAVDLGGPPEWGFRAYALSPAGLSHHTVVISWCRDDIAVFSAAVLPSPEHRGRLYYQGSTGEGRCPQFESLYVSGIRWAAELSRRPR
ncbi:MAG: hypothetical protein NTX53_18810 [candidate division WOR-3 bacterium]|nr:hypothetical protein [candidate division WOR-3 bacterium]